MALSQGQNSQKIVTPCRFAGKSNKKDDPAPAAKPPAQAPLTDEILSQNHRAGFLAFKILLSAVSIKRA